MAVDKERAEALRLKLEQKFGKSALVNATKKSNNFDSSQAGPTKSHFSNSLKKASLQRLANFHQVRTIDGTGNFTAYNNVSSTKKDKLAPSDMQKEMEKNKQIEQMALYKHAMSTISGMKAATDLNSIASKAGLSQSELNKIKSMMSKPVDPKIEEDNDDEELTAIEWKPKNEEELNDE